MKRFLLASIFLVGCAPMMPAYVPTIDTWSDPNPNSIGSDMVECQHLAADAANQGTSIIGNTAIGGLVGGAGGAAIGALLGDPATGAAIGATAGGLNGAVGGAISSDMVYQQVFSGCLRHRGHTVLN